MSCATGMVWSLYEPQKQGGISMILEELKKSNPLAVTGKVV